MKNSSYTSFALLLALVAAATSCIDDDLDKCPPEGGKVEVVLRAEKFRTRPPYGADDLEADFGARIHALDYLLYAGGELLERGSLDDAAAVRGGAYVFRHEPLPFGAYRLVFVANTAPDMLDGRPEAPEKYFILYQGADGGDDHFRADLPFEVTCPIRNGFETVLKRVYGVTRFRFENIPAEVAAVEVSLDRVGARIPLSGEPDLPCEVTKRVAVSDMEARTAGSFLLGTFPTLPGRRSTLRLKLYGENAAAPVYERTVTDTLRIVSNQLLGLTVRFEEGDFTGDIRFSVEVDTSWDGSTEGGGGDIALAAGSPEAIRR